MRDADGAEWIAAHGGLTRENGDRLRRTVLSRGGSADAMGLYRDFAGAAPGVGALLRRGRRHGGPGPAPPEPYKPASLAALLLRRLCRDP